MKGTGKHFGQAFSFKKRPKHDQKFKRKASKPKKIELVDNEINELQQKIESGIDASNVQSFTDLPISKNTLDGLKKAHYVTPTDVQKQAISLALQGKDVLGAAKTGSGKTLAFLIPVLEVLHKQKTSAAFGMCALIITPTRELAFQIFEVLNKIRMFHDFTANLIIGGKKMWREEHLMANTNIVVCTVGRLLHHLDQTPSFNADELKILVLDEADRIMDSKFAKDMDHIIGHLPSGRQTLMFSATQTKSVKALARLSLKDPSYVSVHEHAQHVTPTGLEQSYIVCELHEKLSMLYSFLKNHPNNKIMVFLQTCKQVRFVHTVMRHERPGMTVLALHGGQDQLRRIDIYREFCRKQHVILFTTDLACRGLDFPAVNWVVQLDCPVDVDTYIHRAGRTARFERNGQALLVLVPSEEEHMVEALHRRKIPINKISVNTKKLRDITGSVSSLCVSCKDTKDMAERAFRTYVYSLHVMKNKQVFDISKLDLAKFAQSLGLFITPRLRFLEKAEKRKKGRKEESKDKDEEREEKMDKKAETKKKKKVELKKKVEEKVDDSSDDDSDDDDEDDDDLLKPRSFQGVEKNEEEEEEDENESDEEEETRTGKTLTKAAAAKRLLKKGIIPNTRVQFDEDGNPIRDALKRRHSDEEEDNDEGGIDVQVAAKRLRVEDAVDKKLEKERVKQKHREERLKKKERKRGAQQQRRAEAEEEDEEDEEEPEVLLDGVDSDDDPFKYIPDPDKLAARSESDDDVHSDDAAEDNSENNEDESDDDDDDDDDDSDNDRDDNSDDDDDSSEENDDSWEHHRSLQDAAVKLLQSGRLKK